MQEIKCPICRHELVKSRNLEFIDSGLESSLKLRYITRPQSRLMKKPKDGGMQSHVCLECGYTALFMDHQFRAFLKMKQNQLGERF